MRITVVGGGVIGMTAALELRRAGHGVTIVARERWQATVSAVAGAVWFPFAAERSDAVGALQAQSLRRLTALARDSRTGIDMRVGRVLERTTDADRSWAETVPDVAEIPAAQLPEGVRSGLRARLPLVTVPQHLDWLERSLQAASVRREQRTVATIDELAPDAELVVVAAALGSPALLRDAEPMSPIRGQVVRVRAPGVREWLLDDHNPAGLTYVLPRRDVVVLGGTADPERTDGVPDPAIEAAILERCVALEPRLEGAEVVSRAVGLRPARATLRVERVRGFAVPVVAAYGHGGSGVTLAWGTAARILDLVG